MEQPVQPPGDRPRNVVLGILTIALLGTLVGVLLQIFLGAFGVSLSIFITIPVGILGVTVWLAVAGRIAIARDKK